MRASNTITQIVNGNNKTSIVDGNEYHLLSGTNIENYTSTAVDKTSSAQIAALLSTVSIMEQTIVNSPIPTSHNATDWYSATWKTAAYDFKTRKFRCTGVHYNDNTGYVDKISFEEIDIYN